MELAKTVQEYERSFPCESCRSDFAKLVQAHPFPLETVETELDVRMWTWLTHNLVNERLGKEWYPLCTYLNGTEVPKAP